MAAHYKRKAKKYASMKSLVFRGMDATPFDRSSLQESEPKRRKKTLPYHCITVVLEKFQNVLFA
jgi:hypothetical protein